jgi:excisionase family DNA binding protein
MPDASTADGSAQFAAPVGPFFRKTEVAKLLGASPRSLDSWIAAGLLRVTRPGGYLVRIDAADLDDFIARAKSDGGKRVES